jgi:hypothetical protein
MYKVDYEFGNFFVYKRGKRLPKPFTSFKEAEDHMEELKNVGSIQS